MEQLTAWEVICEVASGIRKAGNAQDRRIAQRYLNDALDAYAEASYLKARARARIAIRFLSPA